MFWKKIRMECFKNSEYYLESFLYTFLILSTLRKNKPSGSCSGVHIFINPISTQSESKYGMSDQSDK